MWRACYSASYVDSTITQELLISLESKIKNKTVIFYIWLPLKVELSCRRYYRLFDVNQAYNSPLKNLALAIHKENTRLYRSPRHPPPERAHIKQKKYILLK